MPVEAAAPLPPPPLPGHILAAGREMRAGALLLIDDLEPQDVVAGQEPNGSFTDTVGNRDRLRGAMVRRSLKQHDMILDADVLRPGDRGFLAAVLGAGSRAVTVGVDPVSGTAGLIWPGDRVDLVLTQALDDKEQPIERRVFSETVLADVRVIAVDQQLVQGGQGNTTSTTTEANRTVTLEATPFDAERVITATRLGKLSLVVRSAAAGVGDKSRAKETFANHDKLGVTTVSMAGSAPAAASDAAVPIAWSGDVSPALRERPSAKAGTMVRVHSGANAAEEVKF